jgi:superfamily II DNA or RNA helicase
MILKLGNSWTTVAGAKQPELDWLREFLSIPDERAEYRERSLAAENARRIREGKRPRPAQESDGKIRLTSRTSAGEVVIPTGLVPLTVSGGKDAGVSVTVVDARPESPPSFDIRRLSEPPWSMRDAYSFQLDAIGDWLSGGLGRVDHPLPMRGIIWSPTGSGKGNIACAVAFSVECRWLFVVHRNHLVHDIADRWGRLTGEDAQVLGAGGFKLGARLTCATLQGLDSIRGTQRHKALIEQTEGLIVDECHIAPARTYVRAVQEFANARARLGLSGTPLDRSDKRSLVALGTIGPIVSRIRARDLISAGVISTPTVCVIPIVHRASYLPWGERYAKRVVENDHRNGAVVAAMERALQLGEGPGMVFVRHVAHGLRLRGMAERRGMSVKFVDGDADLRQRQQAIRELSTGRIDFIIATKVFVEGVDIPNLRTVVCAQGGKSVIDTLQQIGRALRVSGEKRSATIWDLGDKGDPVLHGHARERVAACQREGYSVVVQDTLWPQAP